MLVVKSDAYEPLESSRRRRYFYDAAQLVTRECTQVGTYARHHFEDDVIG